MRTLRYLLLLSLLVGWQTLAICQQGPPGPPGVQGPAGPAGAQGPAGPQGPRGATVEGEIKPLNGVGNSLTGNLIALSPILLHVMILVWVWASKMSLKEALSDKETVRLDKKGEQKKALAELNALLPRTPLAGLTAPPDPTSLQAMIRANQDVRMRLLEVHAQRDANAAAGLTNAPDPPVADPPRIASVSRLIVFMAGHAGVAIGSSLTSFAIFYKLNTTASELPSLNGLVGVILALGIGVVPYAVNRLTADKEPDTGNPK